MSDELLDLMRQSMTIETPATFSGSGEVATWNTAVTVKCQLTGKRKMTFNALGQSVMSGMSAIFLSKNAYDTRSRVTLSTADVGSTEAHLVTPALRSIHRFSNDGFEVVEFLLAGGKAARF